jgi:hypothetical protein
MKRLEDMSIGNRIAITVIIALVILLALAAIGFFTGNWNEDEGARPGYGLASAETHPEKPCMDEATRERIRGIMVEALDDALKNQTIHLFEIWLKDERGQPDRARTGVRQALRAYLGARRAVTEWMPPACPG